MNWLRRHWQSCPILGAHAARESPRGPKRPLATMPVGYGRETYGRVAPSLGLAPPVGTVRAQWRRGARSARTRDPVGITDATHPHRRIGIGPAPSGMGRITRLDYQDQRAGARLDFGPWRISVVRPAKIAKPRGFRTPKDTQCCVDLAWRQRFGIDICRGESINVTPVVPCGPTPARYCCALVVSDRQP